jgi:hypothetical protein
MSSGLTSTTLSIIWFLAITLGSSSSAYLSTQQPLVNYWTRLEELGGVQAERNRDTFALMNNGLRIAQLVDTNKEMVSIVKRLGIGG